MKKDNLPFGLRLARDAQSKSDCDVKVGAAFVRGALAVVAWNKRKGTPAAKRRGYPYFDTTHAEFALFNHALLSAIPLGGVVYVFREVNGSPAMARPCDSCLRMLFSLGITSVVYSVDGHWYKEKLQ